LGTTALDRCKLALTEYCCSPQPKSEGCLLVSGAVFGSAVKILGVNRQWDDVPRSLVRKEHDTAVSCCTGPVFQNKGGNSQVEVTRDKSATVSV
jgi:hypothetical protein